MNAELQVILVFWLDAVLVDSTIGLFSAPTLKRIAALCSRSTSVTCRRANQLLFFGYDRRGVDFSVE